MANNAPQQGQFRGRSFPPKIKERDIEVAVLIDHLRPIRNNPAHHKRGLEAWAVDWSADGHYLAWSQGNKMIQLVPWNKHKHCRLAQDNKNYQGQKIIVRAMTFDAGNLVWSLALGPKDPSLFELKYDEEKEALVLDTRNLILAAGALTEIKVWSVHTGELMYLLTHHKVLVRDLKFAPDGSQRLLGGSRDGSLSVWDLEDDARLLQTFRGFSKWIFGCAWSPNCDLICGVGDKEMVILWKLDEDVHWQLTGHTACVTCCDFSSDGAMLATSSFDTTVIIWDPHTQNKLKTLYHCYNGPDPVMTEHMGWYVRHLAFSWDSRYLVSVCEDRFIRFWDLATPDLPKQVALVSNPLCCSFSPDGIVLTVGNRNGAIIICLSILQVPTLQHLCRMSIRRVLHSTHLDRLHLPTRVRRYLKYFEESVISEDVDEDVDQDEAAPGGSSSSPLPLNGTEEPEEATEQFSRTHFSHDLDLQPSEDVHVAGELLSSDVESSIEETLKTDIR